MNNLFLFVLLAVTFALGTVIGDVYAPISGTTTHALSLRCMALEARAVELEARCAKLEKSVGAASIRLEAWLTQKPAPWLLPTEDGGTRIIGM